MYDQEDLHFPRGLPQIDHLVMLYSIGKDSITMIHLAKAYAFTTQSDTQRGDHR